MVNFNKNLEKIFAIFGHFPEKKCKFMVRACRRQARRLPEGQTTHLALHMAGCRPLPPPSQGPSLWVHLAGKGAIITWPVERSPPD